MSDFWCRRCWRQIGTSEMRAQFAMTGDGDVPRDGFWPVHCWAVKNNVECLNHPTAGAMQWLFYLAHNLAIAAGLCRAFELGWDERLRVMMSLSVDGDWRPGCGRSAP